VHVASPPPERAVLVVSIDGLGRDYLDDTAHALPTLKSLAESGVVARSLVSVWPSSTYPAHATMVTGVSPARHGIVNNVVFDPLGRNDGGWYWYATDIHAGTLWDVAASAHIDVANVTWPVTVRAPIRWNLPQFWKTKRADDETLVCAFATPGLCDELRQAGVAVPGEHRSDRERAAAATFLLRTKRPRLTFVYLTDLDSVQHQYGPGAPRVWETLERTDALLAAILRAAREALPHLAVVLVSDHGFLRIDREVRPNVALRRAGLLQTVGEGVEMRVSSYRAVTWRAGGSAAIMGSSAVKTEVRAVFDDLASAPENGIASVLDGVVVESEGGFPGALVVLQAADGVTFSERVDDPLVAPTRYKGGHGHAPTRREMNASLILEGDGVRAGAALGDVAMVDVAPTIAALLGVHLDGIEGRPLTQALVAR
jgi:hypothetical protein